MMGKRVDGAAFASRSVLPQACHIMRNRTARVGWKQLSVGIQAIWPPLHTRRFCLCRKASPHARSDADKMLN